MSYTFSLEPGEESSPECYSAIAASGLSKSSPTHSKSCSPGSGTESCLPSQSSVMSEISTVDPSRDVLTSWLLAFPARTSHPPEGGLGSMAIKAGCGERFQGSFAKYDRVSSTWRTPQCSLTGDLDEFSGTWPRWGSMRAGECWELDMSGLPTSATGSGSLPTPSGTSNHGKNHVCGRLDEWGGSSNPWRGTDIGRTSSPPFEEWVMGWPVQWTELTAYEMGRFQLWLQLHGKS